MDHHKAAAYANLYTEVHLGETSRPWQSGGRSDRGYRTGSYATFWNLRGDADISWPNSTFGPLMVFMGMQAQGTPFSNLMWHHESMAALQIYPPNLWLSQREKRLGRQ